MDEIVPKKPMQIFITLFVMQLRVTRADKYLKRYDGSVLYYLDWGCYLLGLKSKTV